MPYYSIGEVVKVTKLTEHTLRYYEKEGLLSVERKANGLRIYSDDNIEIINIIHCLKDAGMSIAQIKEYLLLCQDKASENMEGRKKLFEKQREIIVAKLELLNKHLATIDYKIWFYENWAKYGDANDPLNCSTMRQIYEELKGGESANKL